MKKKFKAFTLLTFLLPLTFSLFSHTIASPQTTEKRPIGYFGFFNAIANPHGCLLSLDGQTSAQPFLEGTYTGLMGFPSGKKILHLLHPDYKPSKITFELTPNINPLLLAYLEPTSSSNSQPHKIQLLLLKEPPSSPQHCLIRALYLSSHPWIRLRFNDQLHVLRTGQPTLISETLQPITIYQGSETLGTFQSEDPTYWLLLFYEDSQGKLHMDTVFDVSPANL